MESKSMDFKFDVLQGQLRERERNVSERKHIRGREGESVALSNSYKNTHRKRRLFINY